MENIFGGIQVSSCSELIEGGRGWEGACDPPIIGEFVEMAWDLPQTRDIKAMSCKGIFNGMFWNSLMWVSSENTVSRMKWMACTGGFPYKIEAWKYLAEGEMESMQRGEGPPRDSNEEPDPDPSADLHKAAVEAAEEIIRDCNEYHAGSAGWSGPKHLIESIIVLKMGGAVARWQKKLIDRFLRDSSDKERQFSDTIARVIQDRYALYDQVEEIRAAVCEGKVEDDASAHEAVRHVWGVLAKQVIPAIRLEPGAGAKSSWATCTFEKSNTSSESDGGDYPTLADCVAKGEPVTGDVGQRPEGTLEYWEDAPPK